MGSSMRTRSSVLLLAPLIALGVAASVCAQTAAQAPAAQGPGVITPTPNLHADGMPEPMATILRRSLATDPARRDITMADIAELLKRRDSTIASA